MSVLGAGLMSRESGGSVGEFCVLGPDHPRSSGMGGLSPCSETPRRADGGRGERVPFTRGILPKPVGAVVHSALPPTI